MTNGAPNTQNQDDARQPVEAGDEVVEASARTQADVRGAEEMLVQKLLGVDLRAVSAEGPLEISNRIIERVTAILINTRNQIQALATTGVGEGTLQREIRQRMAAQTELTDRTRAQAVLEAVRATFPSEVVRELTERLWPTVYRLDPEDYEIELKASEMVLSKCRLIGNPPQLQAQLGAPTLPPKKYKVIVDTDHPFWKSPGTSQDDLVQRFTGRSLQECGIRTIPDRFGRGTTLTQRDARTIFKTLSSEVYLLDTAADDPTINNFNGYTVRLKLRHLIAEQARLAIDSNQPLVVLDALFSESNLAEYLRHEDNWARFVESVPNGLTRPIAAAPTAGSTACTDLAKRAFTLLTHPNLGAGAMMLRDVARHQRSLHQFGDKLRKGEVNPWDIATAMTMIQQHGELADVLGGEKNEKVIQQAAGKLQLVRYLGQLRGVDIPQVARAPVNCSLARLKGEIGRIANDLSRLAAGYTTTTSLIPRATVTVRNIDSIRHQLMEISESVSQAESALVRAGQVLEQVSKLIQDQEGVNIASFTLLTLVIASGPPPAIQPNNLTLSTNFAAVADEVQKEFPDLRDEQHYRDELKKLQERSAKAPEGADAVHAIYQNYFKGRGLSERESRNAANELMARNALDTEMEKIVTDATRSAYPVTEDVTALAGIGMGSSPLERLEFRLRGADPFLWRPSRRRRNIVNTVASAFGIPLHGTMADERLPDLSAVQPEQLIRFYYALKSTIGRSARMSLPEHDAETQRYLRMVGEELARRHAKALLYMFKGSLPADVGQDDKAVETILGQPEKLKGVLTQLLRGDPPELHQRAIEAGLARADWNFEFWRRNIIIDRLVGDRWSAKQAIVNKDNPLSLRNIYFGKWGILGLPWRMLRGTPTAAKATGGAVWRERKGIALGAILGTLLCPGVGTLLLGAGGAGLRKFME